MYRRFVCCLCICLVFCVATAAAADSIRDAVVKIHVTQRAPDFLRPWTKRASKKSTGSGAIIAGNRILTNAHVVSYASQIFVQFHQSTERLPAKVVHRWVGMDLALLELEDSTALSQRPTLELADGLPRVKDTVNVYGYPMGGDDMAITEGIISRIEFAGYSAAVSGVRIQVDAALNPGNSGGPALVDSKIVGLVFSNIRAAENIGYLIPAEEVRMFLADCQDGNLEGKWALYDELQTTENASLREKLGLDAATTGVMVRRPYEDDDSYPLRKWDVITKIGDEPIDNKGKVRVRDDLQLLFQYRVPQLAVDGEIPVTILRDKQPQEVSVPVRRRLNRVIPSLEGKYPRHFIYGPVVFMPASTEMIRAAGAKGIGFFLAMDSPLLSRITDKASVPGEQLVVFRLLTHRSVKGYTTHPYGVVSAINGDEVNNLQDVVTLLRDAAGEFIVIEPHGRYETVVLRRAELPSITEEVLDDEGIRYQYSSELEELWEAAATTDQAAGS